jgi:GH25 family lysozyme M1 (1,4-beta-N-acetylmuramidase)
MNHWFSFRVLAEHKPKRPVGQYIAAAMLAVALTAVGTASVTLTNTQQQILTVQPKSGKTQEWTDKRLDEQEEWEEIDSAQITETEPESVASAAPEYVVTPVTKETKPEQAEIESTKQAEAIAAPETTVTTPETTTATVTETSTEPETVEEAPRLVLSTAALEAEDQEQSVREELRPTENEETNGEDDDEAPELPTLSEEEANELLEEGVVLLTPEDLEEAGYSSTEELDAGDENCLRWLFRWLFGIQNTGWQTYGNNTYYYDPNTKQAVKGVQNIDGKLYYFGTDGVLQDVTFGIDVSRYQQSVNWNKVKKAGVEFVIIRIGYRGYQSGTLVLDSMYETHMQQAKAAGLRTGIYFFSQAINEEEAVEEAEACVYVLQTLGHTVDYPIYFDSEYATSSHSGRADNLSVEDRTACAVAFCESILKSGYQAGVYASTNWFRDRLDFSQLTKYSIWNAHYQVNKSGVNCDIWQSTGTGTLDGISGQVDINVSFVG